MSDIDCETLLFVSFVSSAILRCDGQDIWKFVFFVKDKCVFVKAEIFGFAPTDTWDKRNRLEFYCRQKTWLSPEELENDIKTQ